MTPSPVVSGRNVKKKGRLEGGDLLRCKGGKGVGRTKVSQPDGLCFVNP